MNISRTKLRNRDLLEIMRFSYCADKEAFVDAFSKLGIPIESEADLVELERIHNERLDTDGKLALKNSKGEPLKFDIREFVNYNIRLRQNQMKKCNIKFID